MQLLDKCKGVAKSQNIFKERGEIPSFPDGKIGIFVAPSKSYRR